MKERFNYIVPIFNKEDVLPQTLEGIERCASNDDRVFCIVDGCTDRSEEIVDAYIKNSSFKVEKILMPNVHMLLSVNEGLKLVKKGFSVIMQDDIVLEDAQMEDKVVNLYELMKGKLGVISFRYGSNIGIEKFSTRIKSFKTLKKMIVETDFIQSKDDHAGYTKVNHDYFYPRMNAINGPNIIPWYLLSKLGLLDSQLAPYGYDDPEYCLRSLKGGFINGLFPIKYSSELDWGGTRRSKTFIKEVKRIHKRNRIYVYKKHREFLNYYLKNNHIYRGTEIGTELS